jgi:hypothetical protein
MPFPQIVIANSELALCQKSPENSKEGIYK